MGSSRDGRYSPSEHMVCRTDRASPYPEIFVVDVNANKWVKGSPTVIR